MLEEHKHIFANFEEFAKDLLNTTRLVDTNPSAILKLMLVEGWVEDVGRISSKEGELSLLWKQIPIYNSALSMSLANNKKN